jgi:DnaJ-class molecular chaperone
MGNNNSSYSNGSFDNVTPITNLKSSKSSKSLKTNNKKKMSLSGMRTCSKCMGKGIVGTYPDFTPSCTKCDGTGYVYKNNY